MDGNTTSAARGWWSPNKTPPPSWLIHRDRCSFPAGESRVASSDVGDEHGGRALRAQKETYLHTITQAWSAPATEHGAAPAVFLLQCRRRAVAWWSPSSENPGASERQDFFCGQRRGAGEYEIGNISYYGIVHPWFNIFPCAKNCVFSC